MRYPTINRSRSCRCAMTPTLAFGRANEIRGYLWVRCPEGSWLPSSSKGGKCLTASNSMKKGDCLTSVRAEHCCKGIHIPNDIHSFSIVRLCSFATASTTTSVSNGIELETPSLQILIISRASAHIYVSFTARKANSSSFWKEFFQFAVITVVGDKLQQLPVSHFVRVVCFSLLSHTTSNR
jgi:hypothetical protein